MLAFFSQRTSRRRKRLIHECCDFDYPSTGLAPTRPTLTFFSHWLCPAPERCSASNDHQPQATENRLCKLHERPFCQSGGTMAQDPYEGESHLSCIQFSLLHQRITRHHWRPNGMAYLSPILARQDGAKSLFLANGCRIPAPKAVRWSRC